MLGSFVSAPLRRPSGSLAVADWQWLTRQPSCGFADDIEVVADREILTATDNAEYSQGFTAPGAIAPDAPPPDPPGSGIATYLWARLAGRPWGPVLMTGNALATDAYDVRVDRITRPGHSDRHDFYQVDVSPAGREGTRCPARAGC